MLQVAPDEEITSVEYVYLVTVLDRKKKEAPPRKM